MKNNHLIASFVIIICVVLDQITKAWAEQTLQNRGVVQIIGDYVILQYAENTGAFLSLGANLSPHARFLIFSGFVCLFLIYLAHQLFFKKHDQTTALGLSFVLAGGIGNLIDRVSRGNVIDFMNIGFGPVRTGIFNVADMAIVAGVILLLLFPQKKTIKH